MSLRPGTIECVDSHTAGEPTRVVVGGLPHVPGGRMADKRAWLARRLDGLRTALMHEPRGHADMFGAVILPPTTSQAHLGVVFMDGGGYLNMCGHGAIGVATVAVETGLVAAVEPETEVVLDAPAGLVRARVRVDAGHAREVVLENVPSFLVHRDISVEFPGARAITCDVAFGGSFFALVDAAAHHLQWDPLSKGVAPEGRGDCAARRPLIDVGLALRDELNRRYPVAHPQQPEIAGVDLVEFWRRSETAGVDYENLVVFGAGQVDRSPCGTGTSAHLAALVARGQLALGAKTIHAGPVGATFAAAALREARVGEYAAIVPEITGRAWITGYSQFVFDPDDPLRAGFRV